MKNNSKEIHMGRLIQVLSHQMKRKSCVNSMINDDGLTTMQKHVLKFLLLETLHKVVAHQKDIEERISDPQIHGDRNAAASRKNGFIVRESEKKRCPSETHHSYKESGSTPSEHPCTHIRQSGNTAYDRYFRS